MHQNSTLQRTALSACSRFLPAVRIGCILIGSLSCQLLSAQYNQEAKVPETWKSGFESITEADSATLVRIIASEHFAGRGTGQPGYVKAAHFVAGKLAEYGFEPAGENTDYFQNLPFSRVGPNTSGSSLRIGDRVWAADASENSSDELQIGFTSFNATQRVDRSIVFVNAKGRNLTIGDPSTYADKIVVVNTEQTGLSFLRPLMQTKPAAILQVVDGKVQNRSRVVKGGGMGSGGSLRVQVTRQLAAEIAAECGVDPQLVQPRAEEGTSFGISNTRMRIDLKLLETPLRVPNVIGWLEGSDPEVNHEYIIIGAHLDHLGQRDGKIYPGADDNASGSAAILQIARALQINKVRPRRSVLFIAFAGEEIGLLGSKYFAAHPTRPLKNCVCMLNIDMIGRNEETDGELASENETSIHLVGTKKYPSLHETVLEANRYVGFDFEYDEERVARRSDQHSFAEKKIPNTFLFGGFNPYYHQTTDVLKGINYSKVSNCARLNYACIFLAAEHGHYSLEQRGEDQSGEDQSGEEQSVRERKEAVQRTTNDSASSDGKPDSAE